MTSVEFAGIARRLGEASRRAGIEPPEFRSPPRKVGLRRSIRRRADGSAVVSVAVRDRPVLAVVADMIDGVLVAAGEAPDDLRDQLWAAAAPAAAATSERAAA